jgi:hypothetical protein
MAKRKEDTMAQDITAAPATAMAMTDEEMMRLAEQHAGLGQSDREEDKIQAWVKVLHQLSPELNRNEPSYAGPEAAPGDIWIAANSLLIPGSIGFLFQQCGYQYSWVEWPGQPGSGGRPVARHDKKPDHLGGDNSVFGKIELPNGHQIIETRYHLGLIYAEGQPPFPATISYSSTGSRMSTNLTHKLQAKRLPNGVMAPTCMFLYRMTTTPQKNDRGQSWHLLMPGQDQRATPEQFKVGLEVSEKIKSHLLQMGEEEATNRQIDEIPF